MSSNRFALEAIMDEHHMKHFAREENGEPSWILLFEHGSILIRLIENGEFLLVRTLPLAKLDRLTTSQQSNLLKNLLKRNNDLKLGHYSADDEVSFEAALPIEDGDITSKQFLRCVGVVSSELLYFANNKDALCVDQPNAGDSLDQLMQRLCHGDDSNSPTVALTDTSKSTELVQEDLNETSKNQLGGIISVSSSHDYRIVLQSFNERKAEVAEIVQQLTGLTFIESKRLVENTPAIIGSWCSLQEADMALQKLIQAGATAEIE